MMTGYEVVGLRPTFLTSMPEVPSNTCTTARFPAIHLHQLTHPRQPAHQAKGKLTSRLQHLSTPLRPIGKSQRDNLIEAREFHLQTSQPSVSKRIFSTPLLLTMQIIKTYILQDDQRPIDAANGVVPYARLDGHGPVPGFLVARHCRCSLFSFLDTGRTAGRCFLE